ncbi:MULTISPECIES: helix-turn-helix domain-containing protein [unclassified Nocardioides]|uniref:helix-turn-helix domain-containing protein n=1 Tax=unclassified Nocardioides TaxID=2615069 RepID=UPI000702A5AA|nr:MULTISPECIES: helix-turn-helix domain-containing protein [unclassified Nocardioides]KRC54698.1 hypothetical protein ASE19_04240 [Nocardioides sp. Root79]KRC73956.1 hypothetical protein ASE20_04975 [Nocardioides sp. Root240]
MTTHSPNQSSPAGLDQLLGVEELASYLGVPVKTVYDWRQTGRGPCAIRVGRHLKYAVTDVRHWLDSHRDRQSDPASNEA